MLHLLTERILDQLERGFLNSLINWSVEFVSTCIFDVKPTATSYYLYL